MRQARLHHLNSLWSSKNRPLHRSSKNRLPHRSSHSSRHLFRNSHNRKLLSRDNQLNKRQPSRHHRQLLPVKPRLSSQVTPSTRSPLNRALTVAGRHSSSSTPIGSLMQHSSSMASNWHSNVLAALK